MFKRLLSGQINSITVAAGLVAMSSFVSKMLGLFRDRVLAGEFGAGDALDVYYAAFRLPDLIFNLLVLGALSAGFIPILTCLIRDPWCKLKTAFHKSPNREAWELASSILNILGLCLLVLSVSGIVLAPLLMKLIAPGFPPEKLALTVGLTRVMFLSPVFLGISSVLGGILQSFKRFFVYSLAPIMYNVGIIMGALFLAPRWGVYGLAWGVVLGAFLHMIIQLPAVIELGFRYVPVIDIRNRNIRDIGRMMIPRTMSLATQQVNLVVITMIASTLVGGSLAVFNFANNLQSFPVGIFGISFAIAAFPTLSSVAFSRKKLVANFSGTLRQIFFFVIPATVLLVALRAQIIRVILGTGMFDWEDTVLTINTLGYFSLSLFAQASIPLLVRVFYARHNSRTPFIIGLVTVGTNVALSWWLAGRLGVAGLALAFSASNILNFSILWIVLRIELEDMDEIRILTSTVKFSAAAVLAGVIVQIMKLAVWPFIDMTRLWGVLTQGLVAGTAGIIVYGAVCALLGSEEFFAFWGAIKRRLSFRRVEVDDHGEARGI